MSKNNSKSGMLSKNNLRITEEGKTGTRTTLLIKNSLMISAITSPGTFVTYQTYKITVPYLMRVKCVWYILLVSTVWSATDCILTILHGY